MEGAQRTEIEDDYSFSAKLSCAALPRKRPELDIPSVSTGLEIAHPPPPAASAGASLAAGQANDTGQSYHLEGQTEHGLLMVFNRREYT